MIRSELAVLCLLLGGCADLELGVPDTCGNNVVEPALGEDCDLVPDPSLGEGLACGPPDGTPRACRYVCGASTSCPAGSACFPDGVCRYPSGGYAPEDEPRAVVRMDRFFAAPFLGGRDAQALALLDGDLRLLDLDEDAESRVLSRLSLGAPRGEPAVAAADEDDAPLIFMPSAGPGDALQLHVLEVLEGRLGAAMGARRPRAEVIDRIVPVSVGASDRLLRLAREPGSVVVTVDDTACASTSWAVPEGAPLLRPVARGGLVAVAVEGATRVVVSTATAASDPECPVALSAGRSVPLPGPIDESGPWLIDLDDDGRLDLLTAVEGREVAVARGEDGGFAASAGDDRLRVFDRLPPEQRRGCGGERLLLAVGDLNRDRTPDFVTEDGVFSSTPDGDWALTYLRTRGDGWADAHIADFDGDGRPDVAVTVRAASLDCNPASLELLRGAEGGFVGSTVDAVSAPERLRGGDFDLDGVADLALLEQNRDEALEAVVLYGDAQAPLRASARVGEFEAVVAFEALVRPDGPFNPDRASDLVVVPGDESSALSFIDGSPGRALTSPLALDDETTLVCGAGSLVDGEDDGPDLVLIGPTRSRLSEGSDVLLGIAPPAASIDWGDLRPRCATVRVFEGAPLAVAVDGWLPKSALAIEGGAGLGCDPFERAPTLAVLDPRTGQVRARRLETEGRVVRAVELGDFDLDGAPDAAILFAYVGEARRGRLEFVFDLTGAPRAPVVPWPELDVLGFAAVDADRDPHPELALFTEQGLYVADGAAPDVTRATEPVDFERDRGPVQLEAADVDGDGLEDLVLLFGEGLFVFTTEPSR